MPGQRTWCCLWVCAPQQRAGMGACGRTAGTPTSRTPYRSPAAPQDQLCRLSAAARSVCPGICLLGELLSKHGRCLCRPPFLPLAPVQAEHPAAGSFPGTTGSPGDWDPAWAWVCPVGMGFPGKTPSLSPHKWAGMLGLPPSAQSPVQGDGKGVCPMYGAVPQQGLPCLAGEQDKARIKLE